MYNNITKYKIWNYRKYGIIENIERYKIWKDRNLLIDSKYVYIHNM